MEKENRLKRGPIIEWLDIAFLFKSNGLIELHVAEELYKFVWSVFEYDDFSNPFATMTKEELSKNKEFKKILKVEDVFTKRGLRIARKNGIKYVKEKGCIGLITLFELCEFLESLYKEPEFSLKYLRIGHKNVDGLFKILWEEESPSNFIEFLDSVERDELPKYYMAVEIDDRFTAEEIIEIAKKFGGIPLW